ncbi:MAG: iron ABC transporter permease, partial [SAR324 cluster bacterium]|nr:iron ABC transporter permease [SAR324 cluster bacterium]
MIGVGAGWLVAMQEFPGRRVLEWALLLPMAFPGYVLAIVYVEVFEYAGPVQALLRELFGWSSPRDYWFPDIASVGGAVFLLSLALYPYVYLLARNAFTQQASVLLDASRMLGHPSRKAFWEVALPQARPAIIVGISLALMETLADFGTVQLLAVPTFTTGIYHTWFGTNNAPGAAQLALALLGGVTLLFVLERWSRRQQRFHTRSTATKFPLRHPCPGIRGWLTLLAGALPLLLGFVLPALFLLGWALHSWERLPLDRFVDDASHSLLLAAVTAGLAVVLGVALGYGMRLCRQRLVRVLIRIVSLGYAIPGPVVALGLLIPLAQLDQRINPWLEQQFGMGAAYLLSGTLFILIAAYLTRFLALAFGTTESGLAHITPSMDETSRTLGKSTSQTLYSVHVPLLRGSLLTALLLVFVDVMKELPATLMLRPFNFNTLATRAYGYASDEMLEPAALWCLAIVVVGLTPVVLLNR